MIKILVADDEEGIRNLMQMTLELDGYQVFTASDGDVALEIFSQEKPEIALLDIKMPRVDGIQVLSQIKDQWPETEVIMITGHGDMEVAVECLRRQASNFLTKPISEELLSLSIKRSLEKINLKRRLKKYMTNLEILVREANIELERAYHFRENIIENSPDAIVCVRKGGEIIIFNSAAEKLLDYKKSEVIGRMNIVHLYEPGIAKQIMRDLRSSNYGGKGIVQKREVNLIDKHRNEIPVYISAAIIYEDGQEAGSMGVFTDLRERKELEKQLLRSEKLSSLGQLSAGIAHEINQPLTGVLTFAHLLHTKFKNDESTSKDLDVIIRETTRIQKIVQGILEFAKETPIKKTPQDINTIIDKTLELISRQKQFLDISIKKQYGSELPRATVDANMFEQVFMNIALNAAEAMEGNGILTFTTTQAENAIVIAIADTGKGIPENIIDKIFDPFFSTKASSEGMSMGLGLAITYGIIKNHDGDIQVMSKPGEGTTFKITLPVSNNNAE